MQPVAGCALFNLPDEWLAWNTHIQHPGPVQQLRAQLFGRLVPQRARALRELHIAGSFGVGDAINAGTAGMAAAAMWRRELIEAHHGKAAPGELHGGETTHRSQPDDCNVVVLASTHECLSLSRGGSTDRDQSRRDG